MTESDHYEIVCETAQYDSLADALNKAGVVADSSELAYLPNNVVKISDEDSAKSIEISRNPRRFRGCQSSPWEL